MRYREFLPAKALRGVIQNYWIFEKSSQEILFDSDQFMPEPASRIVFQLLGNYLPMSPSKSALNLQPAAKVLALGPSRIAEEVYLKGDCLHVGVSFAPGAIPRLALFNPLEISGPVSFETPWSLRVWQRLGDVKADEKEPLNSYVELLDASFLPCLQEQRSLNWPQIASLLLDPNSSYEITDLADLCGISTRTLERQCQQATGYTPCEYRNLLRCDHARSHLYTLEQPDYVNLAVHLGFFDLPHFCRTFKRWCGMSPGDYHNYCSQFRHLMIGENEMRRFTQKEPVPILSY